MAMGQAAMRSSPASENPTAPLENKSGASAAERAMEPVKIRGDQGVSKTGGTTAEMNKMAENVSHPTEMSSAWMRGSRGIGSRPGMRWEQLYGSLAPRAAPEAQTV